MTYFLLEEINHDFFHDRDVYWNFKARAGKNVLKEHCPCICCLKYASHFHRKIKMDRILWVYCGLRCCPFDPVIGVKKKRSKKCVFDDN